MPHPARPRDPATGYVHPAKLILGLGISLHGRPAEPVNGLRFVFHGAETGGVHHAQVIPGAGVPLHGRQVEPALGRGYGDLLLRVRPDMRQYALLDHLLEFKAVRLKAVSLTGTELAAKSREELRVLPAVAAALREAETQLAGYRAVLERPGGEPLKPRTHAVVRIGLERLVVSIALAWKAITPAGNGY